MPPESIGPEAVLSQPAQKTITTHRSQGALTACGSRASDEFHPGRYIIHQSMQGCSCFPVDGIYQDITPAGIRSHHRGNSASTHQKTSNDYFFDIEIVYFVFKNEKRSFVMILMRPNFQRFGVCPLNSKRSNEVFERFISAISNLYQQSSSGGRQQTDTALLAQLSFH
jgi:hypothetical protein